MQAAIGNQIGFAVAVLAIDDTCEINPSFANKIAAEFKKEFSIGQRLGQVREAVVQRGPYGSYVQRFVTRGNRECRSRPPC